MPAGKHTESFFFLRNTFSSNGKLPSEASQQVVGLQVGRQVLPGPRSHRAVLRRKPTAKLRTHKATPSPPPGDGRTRLLCATKVLQSWNLTLQTCSPKIPLKSKIRLLGGSFLQAAWWVPASGLPTPQLPDQSLKKSRGHHKFGTFIYATDFLKRKESQKE